MFGDTLLESSAAASKRKRWPMATAFTVETIVAAILVIVPLLSTGVIPVSARMRIVAPLERVHLEPAKPRSGDHLSRSGTATAPTAAEVVLVSDNPNRIAWGVSKERTTDGTDVKPGDPNIGKKDAIPNLGVDSGKNVKLLPKRIPVSTLAEAQLMNRVEPVYPRMAVLSGVQGQVRLHAIIARDGRIISLNVTSGHPLLVRAAEDAVRQWRYRPYFLNGEAVEVETFITVNFRREGR